MGKLDKEKLSNRFINVKSEIEKLITTLKGKDPSEYNFIKDSYDMKSYSMGGLKNIHGFFSFDKFDELVLTNYNKGKIVKETKTYDFQYYFSNGYLRLIEKMSDKYVYSINFIYYFTEKVLVVGYRPDFANQTLRLDSITLCFLDNNNNLYESAIALISTNVINSLFFHRYMNCGDTIIVQKESMYINGLVGKKDLFESIRNVDMCLLDELKHSNFIKK
jgi:hypothetical protein